MKRFLVINLLGSFLSAFCFASTALEVKTVNLGVLDLRSRGDFDAQVLPYMKEQLKSCNSCAVVNLTPYDESGNYQAEALLETLEKSDGNINILLINWNKKITDKDNVLKQAFQKLIDSGVVIVSSAGIAQENDGSHFLNRTLFGQLSNAFIIGELAEKDRLISSSFYGPEMLTAFRPQKDLAGKDLSAALFASRWAINWKKRTTTEWIQRIKDKKSKTRKIWLDIEDFFPR